MQACTTRYIGIALTACLMALTGPDDATAAPLAAAELDFRQVGTASNRDDNLDPLPFSGGLWVDDNGDVVGRHNFSTNNNSSNPDIQGTPLEDFAAQTGGNGRVAAQWAFELRNLTGNLSGVANADGPVSTFAAWDGRIFGSDPATSDGDPNTTGDEFNTNVGPIFFSHIFNDGSDFANSEATWVLNNNSDATPGASVGDVWTYLDITDQNQGFGEFAFVAEDPNDVMGVQNLLLGQNNTDAAFVGTDGDQGFVGAAEVPVPSAFALLTSALVTLVPVVAVGRRGRTA